MVFPRATRSLLWSSLALALPALAGGQGFALNELGSCAVARGFAVTAGGCSDASLVFWNPAGTVRLGDGWSTLAGVASIALNGMYTRDTTQRQHKTDIPTAIVPHVFLSHPVTLAGSRLALGGGLYVPYGLTSQWRDDFPGRFASKKAALKSIYVQPNIAYQITDNWSIGGGPVYVHSTVELIQAIDLAPVGVPGLPITFAHLGIAKGTEIGTVNLKGSGTSFGGTIGIMGKLTNNWTVGARYLSKVKVDYDDADAVFMQTTTGLVVPSTIGSGATAIPAGTKIDDLVASQFTTGRLTKQHASTEITHPAQAQIGFNYTGFKHWNVEFDYQWTGFKEFKEVQVTFDTASLSRTLIEDYNSASAFKISAERGFDVTKARLRLGLAGVTTAAPAATVTPLLPEQQRAYFTIGGAYPVSSTWTVDGAYANIKTAGRRGRTDERVPDRTIDSAPLINGVYSLSAHIFSISLKASF